MPTLETVLFATVAVLALAAGLLFLAWRLAVKRAATEESKFGAISNVIEQRLGEVARIQSEMKGGVQAMAEAFGSRQTEIASGLTERMEGLGQRIGISMGETTRNTFESLAKLQERLAVIDTAQRTITDLSTQVVELQHILSDKQQRGIFGQARMEAIVQDGLPLGAYSFQATLSNGRRPDCVVKLPNGAPRIVIDAKFPLEAWNAMRTAQLAGHTATASQTLFRRDVSAHVRAIRERYFIAGETQDTAIMFVPSESIFADIHERFPEIIQEAYRNRVMIVSPSLLMMSIQVMQAVLKDARMREQADIIRNQVVTLIKDVARLDKRVRELQLHFGQAARDVDQILISTGKIVTRGERISAVDLSEDPPAATAPVAGPVAEPAGQVAASPAASAGPLFAAPANGSVPLPNGGAETHDAPSVPGNGAAAAVIPPAPAPPTAVAAKYVEELFGTMPEPASPPEPPAKPDQPPRGSGTVEKLISVLAGVPPAPAGERVPDVIFMPPPRPPGS